jgi:DoxX-like family
MAIYVETRIHRPIDEVWQKTQLPELHERWDLRFTDIEYLPRNDESQPQQFHYGTRIGFGIAIRGAGESVGNRDAADGSRTSALKFWSNDAKSLIKEGAGYWKYIPTHDGVRFLTGYDYQTRFGIIGKAIDAILFRPLIGWATAWSFDRLRLWVEKGIAPEVSRNQALMHALATVVIAFVWVYQGAVPKLIARHSDELQMLIDAGSATATAPTMLRFVGWGEVAVGLFVLALGHTRWPFVLTILLMVLATVGVVVNSPSYLWAAFNPVSLNVLMAAMSLVGLATVRNIPLARRCLRKPRDSAP